jgi:quercetin dioxygenase-like cupin family protein
MGGGECPGGPEARSRIWRNSIVAAPRFLGAGQGPWLAVGGDALRILTRGSDTGGALACLELLIPPGGGPPPHTHAREDEAFYVATGQVAFDVGTQRFAAGPGAYLFAPRGVRHSYRNAGSEPARLLVAITPAGLEAFFQQVGVALDDPSRVAPPTIADIERLISPAARYCVEIHTAGAAERL